MKYYIITGTSRGLGEAIALKLITSNTQLFCISRTRNEQLIKSAQIKNCAINYYQFDLGNVYQIDSLIDSIFDNIDYSPAESITLINNAGLLNPITKVENITTNDAVHNLQVNIVAPFILTTRFLNRTKHLTVKKTIVNISSGAAKKPYSGWSAYCSSKAALEMLTKVTAQEQSESVNQTTVISFIPGVIDTDMQTTIRNTDENDFQSVKRFRDLKKDGKLLSPGFVAEKLVELINSKDIIQGGNYDIRDLVDLHF